MDAIFFLAILAATAALSFWIALGAARLALEAVLALARGRRDV